MDLENINQYFFDELYKEISNDKMKNSIYEEKSKKCLISGEELEKNHIILVCKHTFNYKHILNEVYQQKKGYNNNEITRLKYNQIKCPYCRNIQEYVLPKMEGYPLYLGVNSPPRYRMKFNKCNYVFKSGKKKGSMCDKSCSFSNCNRCSSLIYKSNKRVNLKKLNTQNSKLCNIILKSGKRKGEMCGKKVKKGDYCGIHSKVNKNTVQ